METTPLVSNPKQRYSLIDTDENMADNKELEAPPLVNKSNPQAGVEEEEEEHEEFDLVFAFRSLSTLIKPVSITMILTALCTTYLTSPNDATSKTGLNSYLVTDEGQQSSSGEKFGAALLNALVFVAAIIGATFVLVLLYYLRCIKVIIGWLAISVIALLAGSGGFVLVRALFVMDARVDVITFYLFLYNFAIGGVLSIFWHGPTLVKQVYLVLVSAIMAFLLSLLPEWTTWTFMAALSIYDLCAVLSPCGPLKCLIEMAQTREEAIPALLYEAHPNRGVNEQIRQTQSADEASSRAPNTATATTTNNATNTTSAKASSPSVGAAAPSGSSSPVPMRLNVIVPPTTSPRVQSPSGVSNHSQSSADMLLNHSNTNSNNNSFINPSDAPTLYVDNYVTPSKPQQQPQQQLQSQPEQPEELVDEDRSIKLGLGDFVIYSLLVGRAALFGFATFVTCFVSVLTGLAATLTILAVFKKALPALPFSVALGIIFYFITRIMVWPYMLEFIITPVVI